ncbi:MAG: alpha/beta hydrolase [Terricaulis sp.]
MRRREFLSGAGAFAMLGAGCHENSTMRADEHKYLATRFGRIAYRERGAGPGALFLHGFPLNSYQWRDVIAQLSAFRRCIAPDFMGLGFSEPAPEQSLKPRDQAHMLAAVLDALRVDVVDIVANDSGGAVAQLFAILYPARVRTLLLTNCDVETDSPPAALLPVIELAHAGRYADEWLAPWARDPQLARSEQGLGGMCYSLPGQPTDEAIASYLEPLVVSAERKALTDRYASALEENPLAGAEPLLKRLIAPTRIVWGMADTIFSQDSPGYLDSILPQTRGVLRLEKAKLFFPEEYPEVLVEEARILWGVADAQ